MPKKLRRKRPRKPSLVLPEDLKLLAFSETVELTAAAGEDDADPDCKAFTMNAYNGGIMQPNLSGGYIGKGVVLDLTGWKFQPGQSAVNWQHDRKDPVGHIESHTIDNRVKVSGLLSQPCESRSRIIKASKNKYKWRVSVEGSPDFAKAEQITADQTITVNGRRLRGPFLLLKAGVFTGVGFVTTGGDQTATAKIAAELSANGTESMDPTFDEFLEACGIDPAEASKEQRETLQAAYDSQYSDTEPEKPSPKKSPKRKPKPKLDAEDEGDGLNEPAEELTALQKQNRAFAENTKRVNKVNQLVADAMKAAGESGLEIEYDGEKVEDFAAFAIENGLSATEVELTLFRNSAPRGPSIHARSKEDTHNTASMAAAVLLDAGIPLDSPHLSSHAAMKFGVPKELQACVNSDQRQKVMEAAHRYGDPSMEQLASDCLAAEGMHVPRGREDRIEAASASTSLHNVYKATIGASVLVGYMEVARTVDQWSGVDEVNDFKSEQRFLEDFADDLDYLPPNGEADQTSEGASYESLHVDAYAKQATIGLHDYLNNNLGILAKKPRKMGEAAYRTEEKLGWSTLLSNPVMKTTNRPLFNTTDGTDFTATPLSMENEDMLVTEMMTQTHNGELIAVEPGMVYVSTREVRKAKRIYMSGKISNDGGEGEDNPLVDYGIKVNTSGYLDLGVKNPRTKRFHVGSTNTRYMMAKNMEFANRVYLRGRARAPRVRVTQLSQGKWGTNIDILHIFGFGFVALKGVLRAQG